MNGLTGIPGEAAQICGLFAVDIAGFSEPERDDDVLLYLHKALYEMLERAFGGCGVPWHACVHEDRGDGVLVVVPPTLPAASLIDPLPERLRGLIRRHNRLSSPAAAIQLRAACHIGQVHRDEHGFVGNAVNHLFRLLDAAPLKQLLTEAGTELAFVTSDYVYDTIVCRHPTLVDPDVFAAVTVQVRQTTSLGWVHVPGAAAPGAGGWPGGRTDEMAALLASR
jgi:hypothetical protein